MAYLGSINIGKIKAGDTQQVFLPLPADARAYTGIKAIVKDDIVVNYYCHKYDKTNITNKLYSQYDPLYMVKVGDAVGMNFDSLRESA